MILDLVKKVLLSHSKDDPATLLDLIEPKEEEGEQR